MSVELGPSTMPASALLMRAVASSWPRLHPRPQTPKHSRVPFKQRLATPVCRDVRLWRIGSSMIRVCQTPSRVVATYCSWLSRRAHDDGGWLASSCDWPDSFPCRLRAERLSPLPRSAEAERGAGAKRPVLLRGGIDANSASPTNAKTRGAARARVMAPCPLLPRRQRVLRHHGRSGFSAPRCSSSPA